MWVKVSRTWWKGEYDKHQATRMNILYNTTLLNFTQELLTFQGLQLNNLAYRTLTIFFEPVVTTIAVRLKPRNISLNRDFVIQNSGHSTIRRTSLLYQAQYTWKFWHSIATRHTIYYKRLTAFYVKLDYNGRNLILELRINTICSQNIIKEKLKFSVKRNKRCTLKTGSDHIIKYRNWIDRSSQRATKLSNQTNCQPYNSTCTQ